MAQKITLPTCTVCNQPLTMKDGYLSAHHNPGYEAWKAADAKWQEEHPHGSTYPDRPPRTQYENNWVWTHTNCGEEGHYSIAIGRLASPVHALAWVIHLSEKTWFEVRPFADELLKAFPDARSLPV